MATIQEAVKKIIELKGLDIFKNPKQFFALLADLAPEYPKELRIIKNNFDDKIFGLFIDESRKPRNRVWLIKNQLEDFGFADDKVYFFLESFGIPLGWEQEILDLKADCSSQTSYTKPQQKQPTIDSSVQDVTLNDDVIKQLGFMDKNSIPSVFNIPSTYKPYSGIPYRIIKIDDNVFKDCTNLKTVTIPDTVTEIGNSAFEGCRSLEKINIPDSVTKIGDRTFTNCKSLNNIHISNSVVEIGNSAFACCFSLVTAVIPDKVTKISEGLFGKCKSLVNITIPNGVTEIGNLSFAGCAVSSIVIPKTVTKIGERAFANCKNLDIFVIPDSVVEIGLEAFGGCSKLRIFTLPTKYTIFKDDVNRQIDLTSKVKVQNTQIQSPTPPAPKQVQQTASFFKNSKVGDYIKFGSYPQTSNGGVQPIEWQVLAKENNKILVISRHGLDAKCFDSSSNKWANSEIRKWLNGDFYNKAFTDQEKKSINLSNLSDVGTSDNIFLLSKDEAEKYFANDDARRCKATDYAKNNGAYVDDGSIFSNGKGYGFWWLRSPYLSGVHVVYSDGCIDCSGVISDDSLVRPALWINL